MKIKKKILIVLFLVISFVLITGINSYASSVEIGNIKIDEPTIIVINAVLVFIFFLIIEKYIKNGKKLDYVYKEEISYFKEIPNENEATPARAVYLMDGLSSRIYFELPEIFAATMLDLYLKKILDFEIQDSKDIYISINYASAAITLPEDEKIVYDILADAMKDKSIITIEELKKYAKTNYLSISEKLRSIPKVLATYAEESGIIDKQKEKTIKKFYIKFFAYIVMLSLSMFLYTINVEVIELYYPTIANYIYVFTKYCPVIYIGFTVCSAFCYYNTLHSKLSEKAEKEIVQWNALTSYMLKYSFLEENKEADIKSLEKFLVYATSMGISRELIEQIKLAHKEIFEENNVDIKENKECRLLKLVVDENSGKSTFQKLIRQLKNVCGTVLALYDPDNFG